jgi:hypothetical protein
MSFGNATNPMAGVAAQVPPTRPADAQAMPGLFTGLINYLQQAQAQGMMPRPQPQQAQLAPRFPNLMQNPVFNPQARPQGNYMGMGPTPPLADRLMNPAYNPNAQQRNADALAQVMAIQQANPAFLPNRMMPAGTPRTTPAPRATFTPPRLDMGVRRPVNTPVPGRTR